MWAGGSRRLILGCSGNIRICFEQEIRLIDTDELIAKAQNIGVCMNGNTKRPYIPEQIVNNFESTEWIQ